ncbi:MAG: DUF262 domain-containing protein [Phycisphaerales bacterium]|nr:DUF262 domain-containing protein [Phycisphaerales bacterium]
MKVDTILDQIDLGSMARPEFQRGYVWNRDQVRGLMYSLYRKHPVGSLLVWVARTEPVAVLVGEGEDVEEAASQAGYRFFSSPRAFRRYVKEEILADAEMETVGDE